MTTRLVFAIPSKLPRCGAVLLVALAWTISGQIKAPSGGAVPRPRNSEPSHIKLAVRQHLLEMFARSYFPGRTGQLLIVPRKGDIITRPDPNVAFMHGSPWPYDAAIPLMLVGSAVKAGVYSIPAVQQDVAPTLAAAVRIPMPPTATGHKLPVFRTGFTQPRVAMLMVLDGMRRDDFDRYASLLPTLTALRRRGAWFTQAHVNFLPTHTAARHSTIPPGTDPRVHGITGVSVYDFVHGRRHDMFDRG